MEGQYTKGATGVILLMMLIGQAAAGSRKCFAECFLPCIFDLEKSIIDLKKVIPCAGKCIKECELKPLSPDQYYCNLGCSVLTCTSHIDDAAKMEPCVDNCWNNICKISRSKLFE